jgi:hypothetical protein
MRSSDIHQGEAYRLLDLAGRNSEEQSYPDLGEVARDGGHGDGWEVGAKLIAFRAGVDEDDDARMYVDGNPSRRQYVGRNYLEPWTESVAESGFRVGARVRIGPVGQPGEITRPWVNSGSRPGWYVRLDGDSSDDGAWYESNLALIDNPPAATNTERPLTIGDVWEPGNEIEFTATGDVILGNIEVGCKSVNLSRGLNAGVIRSITMTDGGNYDVVVRKTVEDDRTIRFDGITITRNEAYYNGRDWKLINKVDPKKPDVTVTISHVAAEALAAMAGKISGADEEGSPRYEAVNALKMISDAAGLAGYSDSKYWSNLSGTVHFSNPN